MLQSRDKLVLERQLLLQLGDRLAHLRKARGLSAVEAAKRAGISRTTLAAVEAGDPGPAIGTYLRVMSVLGISGELALLAGDVLQAAPAGTAAARSRRARAAVQITVTGGAARHQVQDLQSLALHEAAVRRLRHEPELLAQAQSTLERWLAAGPSHATALWHQWQGILRDRAWRKVLAHTPRAQALRQASPLTAVLPDEARQSVREQVSALREGVVLGDADARGSA